MHLQSQGQDHDPHSSLILQNNHNLARARALLLQRHGVSHGLEATLLKHVDLVGLDFLVLHQLGDDGDVGGEIIVDGRVARDGLAGFADQTEDDGVDGKGVVGGFGGPVGWVIVIRGALDLGNGGGGRGEVAYFGKPGNARTSRRWWRRCAVWWR